DDGVLPLDRLAEPDRREVARRRPDRRQERVGVVDDDGVDGRAADGGAEGEAGDVLGRDRLLAEELGLVGGDLQDRYRGPGGGADVGGVAVEVGGVLELGEDALADGCHGVYLVGGGWGDSGVAGPQATPQAYRATWRRARWAARSGEAR